jgi:hypothetical protein
MKETAIVALLGLFMCLVDAFQTPKLNVVLQERVGSIFCLRGQHSCDPHIRSWLGTQVRASSWVDGRGPSTRNRRRGIVSSTSDAETSLTDSVWFRLFIDGVEKGGLTKTKIGEGADITDIARSVKAECCTFLANIDASTLKVYAYNSDDAPLDPTFLWNVLSHGGDASRPMIVKAPAGIPSDATAAAVPAAQVASSETGKQQRLGCNICSIHM